MKKAYKTIKSQELVPIQQQPTTLDFSNQVLRFSDIIKIAELLSSNKITHADLSGATMTPDMAAILKLALKNCSSITHLKLSNTSLFETHNHYSDGSPCENSLNINVSGIRSIEGFINSVTPTFEVTSYANTQYDATNLYLQLTGIHPVGAVGANDTTIAVTVLIAGRSFHSVIFNPDGQFAAGTLIKFTEQSTGDYFMFKTGSTWVPDVTTQPNTQTMADALKTLFTNAVFAQTHSSHIAKIIASHPIQELILDGFLTTRESLPTILDTVPSMKYLTHLNISNSMFSGASIYQLSSCLQHKSLKKITMDHVVIPSPQDMELFRDIVVAILSINKPLTVSLVNLYSHQGSAPDSPKIPAVEVLKAFGYEKFVKYFEAVDKILTHFFPNDVNEIIYNYVGEPEPLLLFGEDSEVELA